MVDEDAINKSPKLSIPDIPGVSLVAFYGGKPRALQQLIVSLQQLLQREFKDNYIPYDIEQVHATIIGCEGLKTEAGIVNKWFYDLRNEVRYLDLAGFLEYLLTSKLLPLEISFAGYQPNINYQFLSRNRHPSDRSIQLQTSKNSIVPILIGWSCRKNHITDKIERLRRDLQQFGFLHKYHKQPQDIDNDFYLRLGTIEGQYNPQFITTIQQQFNNYLQTIAPTNVTLSKENLAIVKYQDLALTFNSTRIYSLTNLDRDDNFWQQLYR